MGKNDCEFKKATYLENVLPTKDCFLNVQFLSEKDLYLISVD